MQKIKGKLLSAYKFSNLRELRKISDAPFDTNKILTESKVMNYSVFSQSFYIWLYMRMFYTKVLDLTNAYYLALADRDIDWLRQNCEANFFAKIKKFFKQVDGAGFELEFPKNYAKGESDLEMLDDYIHYGVFIERWRNLPKCEYMFSERFVWKRYELMTKPPSEYFPKEGYRDESIPLDERTNEKRLRYAACQYHMIFETTNQLKIIRARDGEIIYGPKDNKKYFSRTRFQLENRRESLSFHNLVITDVDEVLNGNPFVI